MSRNCKRINLITLGFCFYFSIALGLIQGCGKKDNTNNSEPAVVFVNSKPITVSEFERELERLPDPLQQRYQDPEQRKQFLNQVIDRRLMEQAARERGIDQDEAVRAKVEELERRLLLDALQRAVAAEAVTDEAVNAYYEQNNDEFTDERVHVRHILVQEEQQAKALHQQLKDGADFITLARENSVDSTAQRGGDLGYIPRGRMNPKFEATAFSLKAPGDLSEITKTRFGFHIIQLVDPATKQTRPYSQVQFSIRRKLEKEAVENYLIELRGKVQISFPEKG